MGGRRRRGRLCPGFQCVRVDAVVTWVLPFGRSLAQVTRLARAWLHWGTRVGLVLGAVVGVVVVINICGGVMDVCCAWSVQAAVGEAEASPSSAAIAVVAGVVVRVSSMLGFVGVGPVLVVSLVAVSCLGNVR